MPQRRAGRAVLAVLLGTCLAALAACSAPPHAAHPSASRTPLPPLTALDRLPRFFAPDAPANRRVRPDARFEAADGPMDLDLRRNGTSVVNHDAWSFALYRATAADPLVTVRTPDTWRKQVVVRIPAGATTTGGYDDHMGVVQPDGHTAYEFYKMHKHRDGTWTSPYVVKTDLRGSGLGGGARASGTSIFWGVIRSADLRAGRIDHTLLLGLPVASLKAGPVWPARLQDRTAETAYMGTIPMGTLFAIPPSVDIRALGLSAEGLELARALQDYGAYVMIASATASLYVEKAADPAEADALGSQWARLRPLLRAIPDNGP